MNIYSENRRASLRLPRIHLLILGLLLPFLPLRADNDAMEHLGVCIEPQTLALADNPFPIDHLAYCDRIIASGVKWVRFGSTWGRIEPADNQIDEAWLAKLDQIVHRLHANGVQILWVLGYTADWASSAQGTIGSPGFPDSTRFTPRDWDLWTRHVSFIAKHYEGLITHWEVWNEPDNPGFWGGTGTGNQSVVNSDNDRVATYATMLQKTRDALKQVDGNNVVLLGGLALCKPDGKPATSPNNIGPFFNDLLNQPGMSAAFDVINYHTYATDQIQRALDRLHNGVRAVINSHGLTKPIWITETGYTSMGEPSREAGKADSVDQAWLSFTQMPSDVERVFLYTFRNSARPTPNPSEENFGLTSTTTSPSYSTLNPLAAFYSYQSAGGALADPELETLYPSSLVSKFRALFTVPRNDGNQVDNYLRIPASLPEARFAYYRLDDSVAFNTDETFYAEVTYLNNGSANFALEYDKGGSQPSSTSRLAWARPDGDGSGPWLTHVFTLEHARFANRQVDGGGSDLRLFSGTSDLLVKSVVVWSAANPSVRYPLRAIPLTTGNGAHNTLESTVKAGTYLYFDVADLWLPNVENGTTPDNLLVELEYLDSGAGRFQLQYDAVGDSFRPAAIPDTVNGVVAKTGSGGWKALSVTLPGAKLGNRLNGADFRIRVLDTDLTLRSVKLVRPYNLAAVLFTSNPPDSKLLTALPNAPVSTQYGRSCRTIPAGSHLYCQVSDALVPPSCRNVTVTVTYYSSGLSTHKLRLTYRTATTPTVDTRINRSVSSTPGWTTESFVLTDALFDASLQGFSDFSISNGTDDTTGDKYISRIEVVAQ